MTGAELTARLDALAEPNFQKFTSHLIPGAVGIRGVRMPVLRGLAKEIAKSDGEDFLRQAPGTDYEEKLVYGMVLGYAKLPDEKRRAYWNAFLPAVDNWSVCDSTCATCKWMAKNPDYWLPWLENLANSDEEYTVRVGLVSMLDHFLTDDAIDRVLDACAAAHRSGYYAKMAAAWCVATACAKYPEKTEAFLAAGRLQDDFTHNKAIQKARESYRVTAEQKARLSELKRAKSPER